MSKLRSVNTHFWSDNYVIDLNPVEKLLFLYLLTNDNTNMLGIYELHVKKISFDTGIDTDKVLDIFKRFHDEGKASYIDGYVALHNFTKHQSYNDNMKKSAVTSFNELPEKVRIQTFCIPIAKGLEPLPKGMRFKIPTNYKNDDFGEFERVPIRFAMGSEPIAEIEDEVEVEREVEIETESEQGSEINFSEKLEVAKSKNELFDLWFKYRKSMGRHPNLYEKDVLLNADWKNRSIELIRDAIRYTVQNGWFSLQYPEEQKSKQKSKQNGRSEANREDNGQTYTRNDLEAFEFDEST